jgi:REP element-mobilizing transposase RayT
VHLLVHYPPKVAVSDLVNSLKGVSARILRRDLTGRVNRAIMHGYFWPPSYFRRLVRRRPAHGGAAVHRATTPAALATLCGPFRLTLP